jgi:dUTP pyrophosphatase
MKIKIKYHDKDLTKLEKIEKGNWVDLRVSRIRYKIGNLWKEWDLKEKDYCYVQGQDMMFDLGISMQLPDGYEAVVVPRSSTYKNYKVVQTNSMGVIDNSYCGTNDVWLFPCKALYPSIIRHNDRVCQFRIQKIQPNFEFEEVEELENEDRSGFGSTGKN